MTEPEPLPPAVLAEATLEYARVQRVRVETMYNRSRAVFAEFIVAQLLPGATVNVDPASAWDITWPVEPSPVRVEVKCSGEFLPRKGADHRAKAVWKFAIPKTGYNPDTKQVMRTGEHNFDVLILARHVGNSIDAGWTYFVLTRKQAIGLKGRATMAHLGAHQAVGPGQLADAVRKAAGQPRRYPTLACRPSVCRR